MNQTHNLCTYRTMAHAPNHAPNHVPNHVPNIEHVVIHTQDGYTLAGTLYTALGRESGHDGQQNSSEDVVLINSGTGVKRGYYHKFALYLQTHGFTVLTYDYRGIGDSLRTHIKHAEASMSQWGEFDVAAALDWLRERFGSQSRISAIGHSAGGKIVGFARNNDRLTALVTISVPNSYWGLRKPLFKLSYALFVHAIMPTMTHLWSYFPSRLVGLGENYPKGVALEWARWSKHKGYILDPKGGHSWHTFHTMRGDVLAYSFADDFVAQPQAVESLMNFYTNARSRTHRHVKRHEYKAHGIKRIGHSGFFRDQAKPLWKGVLTWLQQVHRQARTTIGTYAPEHTSEHTPEHTA